MALSRSSANVEKIFLVTISQRRSRRGQKSFCRNTEAFFFAVFRKNLFSYTNTNKTNPNFSKSSDLFVFYPNKPVFGLVLMY